MRRHRSDIGISHEQQTDQLHWLDSFYPLRDWVYHRLHRKLLVNDGIGIFFCGLPGLFDSVLSTRRLNVDGASRRYMSSVEDRVVNIVAEQLGVEKDKIKRESNFVNDLGADSLDTVELVMELEEEFDINIPDESAEKIQTVGEAISHIEGSSATA